MSKKPTARPKAPPVYHRDGITIYEPIYFDTSTARKRETNTHGSRTILGLSDRGNYITAFANDIHHSVETPLEFFTNQRKREEYVDAQAREWLRAIFFEFAEDFVTKLRPAPQLEYFDEHPRDWQVLQMLGECYGLLKEGRMTDRHAMRILMLHYHDTDIDARSQLP